MAEKSAKKPNFLVRAGRGIVRFFRDTKGEMKKVVWPSKKQVRNNLVVVLVFVLLAALLIFVLDLAFSWGLKSALDLATKVGADPASSLPSTSGAAAALVSAFTGV